MHKLHFFFLNMSDCLLSDHGMCICMCIDIYIYIYRAIIHFSQYSILIATNPRRCQHWNLSVALSPSPLQPCACATSGFTVTCSWKFPRHNRGAFPTYLYIYLSIFGDILASYLFREKKQKTSSHLEEITMRVWLKSQPARSKHGQFNISDY